jgi:primary-amine oxidase
MYPLDPRHMYPLDPPSKAEIEKAVQIFRASALSGESAAFSVIYLVEPAKAAISPPRVLRLAGTDEIPDGGWESEVNLRSSTVTKFDRLPLGKGQAPYNMVDIGTAIYLAKKHPEFLAALKKRGIEGEKALELLQIDPWPGGGYTHPSIPTGHRAVKCIAFVKTEQGDNGYARPVQGLIAHVDVTSKTVRCVEDHGVVPMPTESARLDTAHLPTPRTDLKPLEIIQPYGASFSVDGQHVEWQRWKLRVSMHPLHGEEMFQVHKLGNWPRSIQTLTAVGTLSTPESSL